ncbi:SDR family NAD(P)-dependent oxidoreductase [Specibacter cremeus]|uniref:SDR family NAD(P)-dependent oxidoreductase n=1 Tax=Specibacter cremeus TaxID=1629051 RepID=UPI000F784930|nr:SDR family NAD(P)-dependent oxidoreductase [Specibacter cremeus]
MNGAGQLEGKIAVVVGASRGIGAAIAQTFAQEGARVVLAARDRPALEKNVATINAAGGDATAVTADVTGEDSMRALLAGIRDTFGRLDIAVNNAAGGGRPPTPLAQWDSADFDSSLAVTLRGVFLSLKYEIELMLDNPAGGAIVNLSSTAGEQGVSGLAGYVSAKYGVGGLTRVAALDYADAGIRVNAIAPGPILTDALAAAGPAAQAGAAAAVPLGRLGQVDDVARAALWLVSDASSFVTGTVLPVDGGRLAGVASFVRKPSTKKA